MTSVSSLAPATENGLAAFIKRNPVISMSVLTLARNDLGGFVFAGTCPYAIA